MASILDLYPEYASTSGLDDLRATEYGYLDEQDHVYLDYTGAGLAARAQHAAHAERLATSVLGNPHSASPTSSAATELVERARARVLEYLNASPDEYVAIFTANATGAARLVGEAYPFCPGSRLVLTADNHNSLHGLREYARRAGAETVYVPSRAPDLGVDPAVLASALVPPPLRHSWPGVPKWLTRWVQPCFGGGGEGEEDEEDEEDKEDKEDEPVDEKAPSTRPDHPHSRGLFAYPAQSNFSGVRHPLAWVAEAQGRGYDVLLDAAAYLPTSPLDLSQVHPDFVLASWYKLFGYPTGVGCLVARRSALARLARPWFSGGTIRAVSVALDWHAPAARPEAQFEDGTVSFQTIPDVLVGLDWLEQRVGRPRLQTRMRCLTGWFLARLLALRHANGRPMVVLYGPASSAGRGATVTFNFVDPAGRLVDERVVAAEAAAARISLRTGCFCNPGAGEIALALSRAELRILQRLAISGAADGKEGGRHALSMDDNANLSNTTIDKTSKTTARLPTATTTTHAAQVPIAGAVRVSFGVASNTADIDRFCAFAESTYRDRAADNSFLLPRHEC